MGRKESYVARGSERHTITLHGYDIGESVVLASLASLRPQKFDGPDELSGQAAKRTAHDERGLCSADAVTPGKQTLFVNASVEGSEKGAAVALAC